MINQDLKNSTYVEPISRKEMLLRALAALGIFCWLVAIAFLPSLVAFVKPVAQVAA